MTNDEQFGVQHLVRASGVPVPKRDKVINPVQCIWFTGLSGAGKSTLASAFADVVIAAGRNAYVLDGDVLRAGLNSDLGFSAADRNENVRRVAEVARLMADAGVLVIVSLISPFRHERALARQRFANGTFAEVFVDTPLTVCEQRDVKGLYARARSGALPNFTGIDSPYEAPEAPELRLQCDRLKVAEAVAVMKTHFRF